MRYGCRAARPAAATAAGPISTLGVDRRTDCGKMRTARVLFDLNTTRRTRKKAAKGIFADPRGKCLNLGQAASTDGLGTVKPVSCEPTTQFRPPGWHTTLDNGMARIESFELDDLLKCGQGELFGMGNPQLPVPNMLMFDRIARISDEGGAYGKGEAIAELDIRPDLWFFQCHFPGDPVMPGCLGLDALWQLLGFFLGWMKCPGRGRALGCGEVKFTGQVLPSVRTVTYRLDVKRLIQRKLVMGIADGTVLADGGLIYTAKDLRVGLFTNTQGALAASAPQAQ